MQQRCSMPHPGLHKKLASHFLQSTLTAFGQEGWEGPPRPWATPPEMVDNLDCPHQRGLKRWRGNLDHGPSKWKIAT